MLNKIIDWFWCLPPVIYIKRFIQRGIRGWGDYDVIDLDQYLARVISETTRQLHNTTISYPPRMTSKQWKRVLTGISNGIILDDSWDNKAVAKQKKALKLLADNFNDLWN